MSVLGELKRRKVFQVAAVYAVVAWLLIEITTTIEEPLGLPGWVDTFVIVLVAIGFPIALILSWAFDVTPEGIKSTPKAEAGEKLAQSPATTFTYVVQGLVLLAVGFLLVDQYVLRSQSGQSNRTGIDSPQSTGVTRFKIDTMVDGIDTNSYGHSAIALSPNGIHFIYRSTDGIYLRRFDELEARQVVVGERLQEPILSPDGNALAYWNGADELLIRVGVSGGAPLVLARNFGRPLGMSWGFDGRIYYSRAEGIFALDDDGTTEPELVIPVTDGRQAFGAQLMPDADSVLYSISTPGNWDAGEIVIESLSDHTRQTLVAGGASARYLPAGQLVYALQDKLYVIGFDIESSEVFGQAIPVVDGVIRGGAAWQTGVAQYSVSNDGTLVFVRGDSDRQSNLVWVNREGEETPIATEPTIYDSVEISPAGDRVVINQFNDDNDILIWDFEAETTTRLTLGRLGGDWPVWSPDGRRIAYHPGVGPVVDWQASNNVGTPERLATGGAGALDPFHPEGFTTSGEQLLFLGRSSPSEKFDIGMIAVGTNAGRTTWLVQGEGDERRAELSPDGRWLAYQSDESGRFEIYVRPFPDVNENRWQVSNRGGTAPIWSRDGRELFYLEPGPMTELKGVAIVPSGAQFSFGERASILDWPYYSVATERSYDISLDGRQFLAIKPNGSQRAPQIIVVRNWFEELRSLAPAE